MSLLKKSQLLVIRIDKEMYKEIIKLSRKLGVSISLASRILIQKGIKNEPRNTK